MKPENTSIRLRKIMADRNLKQIDILKMAEPFCKQYGIKMNKSDISQYVSGKNEPGQDKLTMLGMALHVSEAWLMGYDVPMNRIDRITDELSISTKDIFFKYLENLGYYIEKDDFNNPYIQYDNKTVKIHPSILNDIHMRIDSYTKTIVESEILAAQADELKKQRLKRLKLDQQLMNFYKNPKETKSSKETSCTITSFTDIVSARNYVESLPFFGTYNRNELSDEDIIYIANTISSNKE